MVSTRKAGVIKPQEMQQKITSEGYYNNGEAKISKSAATDDVSNSEGSNNDTLIIATMYIDIRKGH